MVIIIVRFEQCWYRKVSCIAGY